MGIMEILHPNKLLAKAHAIAINSNLTYLPSFHGLSTRFYYWLLIEYLLHKLPDRLRSIFVHLWLRETFLTLRVV
jgi:hypothetical protein